MAKEKDDNGPKIISDDDWKQQAKKEKEKLKENEDAQASAAEGSAGAMPHPVSLTSAYT